MSLITNQINGLYQGVNQQSAEHRTEGQVEEMINAYPTIDKGLLRRNPAQKLDTDGSINYDKNMWVYEYDRGLAGDSEEKYSINITNNGMQIINVVSGKVYSKNNGLLFEPAEAEQYVSSLVNSRSYAATTVKDSTFIVNKNVPPKLDPYVTGLGGTSNLDVSSDTIWFDNNPPKTYTTHYYNRKVKQSDFYPSHLAISSLVSWFVPSVKPVGSTTTVVIDGTSVIYNISKIVYDGYYHASLEQPVTYTEYIDNLKTKIESSLDAQRYLVIKVHDNVNNKTGIKITRTDGNEISTTFSINFNPIPSGDTVGWLADESDYYAGTDNTTTNETIVTPDGLYDKTGHIWIKSSNPSNAYSYSYSIETDANTYSGSVSKTTTEGAASAMAADINSKYGGTFTADSNGGSVVRIRIDNSETIVNVYAGDSWGDQASFGWAKEVQYSTDLPKNMPFGNVLVKVIGSSNNDASYWLKYIDGQWRETLGYHVQPKILPETMPHELKRNEDDTFTLSRFDWDEQLVGDNDTNKPPSFTQDGNVIKDVFFFKNRLGFITNRTVVFSEVGVYGNFWATSVAAVLDSDRIDTTVDTTKAIQLEYATYLEDNLMLFSDKSQFKLEGGKILSPKDIQISQTSAYEINKNIRPLFMNDKVFFCAKRGKNTAVMQYSVYSDGRISEAIDITAHVQTYIPSDATRLSGSPINNMLFITNGSEADTIFVYKYYDDADKRVQSAWFKWTFNGTIYSAFSLGRNLNILINRRTPLAVQDWVISSGIWNDYTLWDNDGTWINEPSDLYGQDEFDIMPIAPVDYKTNLFLDNSEQNNDGNIYGFDIDNTGSINPNILTRDIPDVSTSINEVLNIGCTVELTQGSLTIEYIDSDNEVESFILQSPYNDSYYAEILNVDKTFVSAKATPSADCIAKGFDFSIILPYSNDEFLEHGTYRNSSVDGIPFTEEIESVGSWSKGRLSKFFGTIVPTKVSIGEWVHSVGGKKDIRGHLQFKTVQISSEDDSDFGLVVDDVSRGTTRTVESKYTVNRKPMVYGSAKNIRVGIESKSDKGFRINTVSFEGNFNSRSKRN